MLKAAKTAGLWPASIEDQAHCDMVEASIDDVNAVLKPQWYGHVLGRSPKTGELLVPLSEDQKVQLLKGLNDDILPARFGNIEKCIKGPYFCGSEMTHVDLLFYNLGSGLLDGTYCEGISPSVLTSACPKLIELISLVNAQPKVQEWNATRNAAPAK